MPRLLHHISVRYPKAKVPPVAMCKIASILQIPPFRMPLRDEKAKKQPPF